MGTGPRMGTFRNPTLPRPEMVWRLAGKLAGLRGLNEVLVTNNMTNPFATMAINRLEILAVHFPSLTGQECFELISREIACLKEIRDSWEDEFGKTGDQG